MKRTEPRSIASLMDDYMQRAGWSRTVGAQEASLAWDAVVGERIAQLTGRRRVRDDVLYVTVDSAPLRQDLMAARRSLIFKLNQAVGADVISDIVFL